MSNTVEAGFLLLLAGYPELMWLPVSAVTKVVVMTVTLLPLGVLGLMGINGDSLLRFAVQAVKHWTRRRKLHFRRVGLNYEKTSKPARHGRVKKKRQ